LEVILEVSILWNINVLVINIAKLGGAGGTIVVYTGDIETGLSLSINARGESVSSLGGSGGGGVIRTMNFSEISLDVSGGSMDAGAGLEFVYSVSEVEAQSLTSTSIVNCLPVLTPTITATPSSVIFPSASESSSTIPSSTPTASPSGPSTETPSQSNSRIISTTPTRTPTNSQTPSRSDTPTSSISIGLSSSRSETISISPTKTPTLSTTPSISQFELPPSSLSNSASTSSTRSLSNTLSITPSIKNSPQISLTPSSSITRGSISKTRTSSPSTPPSASITPSRTSPPSLSKSISKSRNPTPLNVVSVDGDVVIQVEVVSEDDNIVGVVAVVEAGNQVQTIIVGQGPPSIDPNVISEVLTVIAVNSNGEEVSLDGKAEICISISERELKDESCLGFLDETKTPPKWICEDPCIELSPSGTEACGKTSHFTSFAILLEGNGNKDPCESSGDEYIFNEAWQDALLITISALVILIIALLTLIVLGFTRIGLHLTYGGEGLRIRTLRNKSSSEITDFR